MKVKGRCGLRRRRAAGIGDGASPKSTPRCELYPSAEKSLKVPYSMVSSEMLISLSLSGASKLEQGQVCCTALSAGQDQ